MEIGFTSSFVKNFNSLEKELAEEVLGKIELFKNPKNHKILKVHKLHGRLKDTYSFSVNYKVRIVFQYDKKDNVIMLAIGDHSIYTK